MDIERLTDLYTYRNADDFVCSDYIAINKDFDGYDAIIQKLGPLEDKEEELGVSLFIVLLALQQETIYVKNPYDEITEHHFMLERRFGKYLIYDKEWLIELKDYKKTWALRKEDLMNE